MKLLENHLNPADGRIAANQLASAGKPFFFMVDAYNERWIVLEVREAYNRGFRWSMGRTEFSDIQNSITRPFRFKRFPVKKTLYEAGFNHIRKAQLAGESWLANLTFPTELDTNLTLKEFAFGSQAAFRLYIPGTLAVFSPERFVRVDSEGTLFSYPMKGTIDAALPGAAERLLNDKKEAAEHVTIVDLIRNDVGMVARNVSVPRYRILDRVRAYNRELYQLSSEITGSLGVDWKERIGTTIDRLLPAGSVTGAPKRKTCEIIRGAESYQRGWYTGIFGVFDGLSLDSAVAIRYVEQTENDSLVYKSGGGITIYSDMDKEYDEMVMKVYAPAC